MPDPKIMSKLKKILWKTVDGEKKLIGCQKDAPCCNSLMSFCVRNNCATGQFYEPAATGPHISPEGVSCFVSFTGFADGNNCDPANANNNEGSVGTDGCGILNTSTFLLNYATGPQITSDGAWIHTIYKAHWAPRAAGEFERHRGDDEEISDNPPVAPKHNFHWAGGAFNRSYTINNPGLGNAALVELNVRDPEWQGSGGGFLNNRPFHDGRLDQNPSPAYFSNSWIADFPDRTPQVNDIYYPVDAPEGADAQFAKRWGFSSAFDESGQGSEEYASKHLSCVFRSPGRMALPNGMCGNRTNPWWKWGNGIRNPAVDDTLNKSDAAINDADREAEFNVAIVSQIYHPDFGKPSVDTNKINVDVGVEIHSKGRRGGPGAVHFRYPTRAAGIVQLVLFSQQFDTETFYCHKTENVEETTYEIPYSDTYNFTHVKSEWPGYGDANFEPCGVPESATITFTPNL